MHWQTQQQRQQKRKAITFLVISLLFFFSLSYMFLSIHNMKKTQGEEFSELKNEIHELKEMYSNDIQSITRSMEQKFDNVEEIVELSKLDYEKKTQDLLTSVEKTEQNSVELEELKQELRNVHGDLSKIIDDSVRSVVSVYSDGVRGSGVIVSQNGIIVTNSHIIDETLPITVVDYEGRMSEVVLLKMDPIRDLAILKTDKSYSDYLDFANSDEIKIGERVIAIGNPEGLDFTVTQGIISGVERVFSEVEGSFIQTDVSINSGSSGGPLIDASGKMIGINTFKLKGTENLGFAIPSNDVKKMLDEI